MEAILDTRSPELTALFRALTRLGDAGFFLLFIPLGYWLWRPGVFARFGLLLLGATMFNVTLKEIFQVPRPDDAQLIHAAGWSFPSGHAQTAATIWPWLALMIGAGVGARGRRWLWPLVALVVVGVATSRVYLGVHTPRDVIAGVLLGVPTAILAHRLARHPPEWWVGLGAFRQALLVLVATLGWCLAVLPISEDPVAATAGGAMVGLWLGFIWQRRLVDFVPPSPGWRALAAMVLGLGGIFTLRFALKAAFVALGLAPAVDHLLRYAAITGWISLVAPWLFVTLGLCMARPREQ